MRLINSISVFLIEILILSLLGKGNSQKNGLIDKICMQNVRGRNKETQGRQGRSPEGQRKPVSDEGGESDDSISNDNKNWGSIGVDPRIIRQNGPERSAHNFLIEEDDRPRGSFRGDHGIIPTAVRINAKGDLGTKEWQFSAGRWQKSDGGFSQKTYKRAYRKERGSMEDSLFEESGQSQRGYSESDTAENSGDRKDFIFAKIEDGDQNNNNSKRVAIQEGHYPSGGSHTQLDSKNESERQGSNPTESFNGSYNIGTYWETSTKLIDSVIHESSDPFQQCRLTPVPKATASKDDNKDRGSSGQSPTERCHTASSFIPSGLLQGVSTCIAAGLISSSHSSSSSQSVNFGTGKISEFSETESLEIQHQKGSITFPCGSRSGEDGSINLSSTNNIPLRTPLPTQKCNICNKTVQLRNFATHLKSTLHATNLEAKITRENTADIDPTQMEIIDDTSLLYDKSLLHKIYSRSDITTLKSIPKNIRRNIAMVTGTLHRNSNNNVRLIQPHVELLIFSKIVLANMTSLESKNISNKKRRKVQTKYTKDRLDKWLLGGEVRDNLILSVLKSPLATYFRQPQSPASNMKRCLKLVTEYGQYSKAVQSLSSDGITEPSAETTIQLQEKHPSGQLPTPVDLTGVESIQINMEDITLALRSFPKGTACGRSGLRVSHLMETLYLGTNLDNEFLTHVNYLVQGKAPPELAAFYASASLIALKKKDFSIRPIAVGEIIRRLTSKICLRKVTAKAIKYFAPYQLGIGIPNAIETILHGLNSLIRGEDVDVDAIFLLLDFENAFNMIGREFFFQEAFKLFPEISHWIQYTYGCAAFLFTGADVVLSYIGVQQGDPLGPLLFCLVLQLLLLRINDKFKGIPTPAYLDDVTIGGLKDAVTARSALDFIRMEGPIYGLKLNMSKTIVFQPHGLLESTIPYFPDIRVCSALGTELLGGALSLHGSYFTESAFKKVDKAIISLSLIMTINSVQVKLHLIRLTNGMKKINNIWRLYDPDTLTLPSAKMQTALFLALRSIIVSDGPHFGDLQFQFSSLPTSLGGLGVSLPNQLLNFAYVASQLSTLTAQKNLFGSLSGELSPVLLELCNKFSAILPNHSPSTLNTIIMPHKKKQNQLASWFYSELRGTL
jgi:hypothetical protein